MKIITGILAMLTATCCFSQQVILFDNANFTGDTRAFSIGSYRLYNLTDFNDRASSIKIPAGMAAMIFEHADEAGGYGRLIDLMEDCADLSRLQFDNATSYIIVFTTSNNGLVWGRGRIENGQYIPGHWERQRANGVLPPNNGPVVSPYNPARGSGAEYCNPNLCFDLVDRLEALKGGAMTSYFPSAAEQKPVIDSIVAVYENSPAGIQALRKYELALKDYMVRLNRWERLPPYKQEQIPEPERPARPIPAYSTEHLRSMAITILKAKNHAREIGATEQRIRDCQCDVIGYGNPTPVFTDTAITVNDIRTTLPRFTDTLLYDKAINDQMGVIGSDYRPKRSIGSAAFERRFEKGFWGPIANFVGASNFNFWFPQKRIGERSSYKQTLVGQMWDIHKSDLKTNLPDFDVNIIITPDVNYKYLITEAHKPEVTFLTNMDARRQSKTPSCPLEFINVEAEIDMVATAKQTLLSLNNRRIGKRICVYGPWIYDAGHCDHPEIHPAEQVWWSDRDIDKPREFYCNVFCDASKRFWWRNQMDNGTKIKPWGAPPIEGVFAIAFEVTPGQPARTFEVSDIDAYNVVNPPARNKSYNLVYQGHTIVSFIPHNNAFKVSYEKVGLVGNKIRGFLVISTTVGSIRQKTTEVVIQPQDPSKPYNTKKTITFPWGTDVNKIDQRWEDDVFEKKEGHYMFKITRSHFKN